MKIASTLLASALSLMLTGCDSGLQHSGSTAPRSAAPHEITGLILDEDGNVSAAHVLVRDNSGATVASTDSSAEGEYRVDIPASATYPLIFEASLQGVQTPLKAAVTSELASEQDISAVSTIVVDTALSFGGLSEANLAKAAGAAIAQRKKSGGTGSSTGFKGDPTKQYGGWH